jgi:hypothetical protein
MTQKNTEHSQLRVTMAGSCIHTDEHEQSQPQCSSMQPDVGNGRKKRIPAATRKLPPLFQDFHPQEQHTAAHRNPDGCRIAEGSKSGIALTRARAPATRLRGQAFSKEGRAEARTADIFRLFSYCKMQLFPDQSLLSFNQYQFSEFVGKRSRCLLLWLVKSVLLCLYQEMLMLRTHDSMARLYL